MQVKTLNSEFLKIQHERDEEKEKVKKLEK